MTSWAEAVLFAVTVFAFVMGVSSLIMGMIPVSTNGMKEKVEYAFFGISGLVIALVLFIALVW